MTTGTGFPCARKELRTPRAPSTKIDMTAGMVDAWMAALLTNKPFRGGFDEMFKPFPGDIQCGQWLHDTELSLHGCRKATGPVPVEDVR